MSALSGNQHIVWQNICYLISNQYVCAALLELHKGDIIPSGAEFNTLELFVKVMKPLVDIIEAIGAER